MKRLLASLTILVSFPTAALAERVEVYENRTGLTPKVEDRSVLQDIERIHPHVGPDNTKYDPAAINVIRGRNLWNNQEHSKLYRRHFGQSHAKCLYPSPWPTGSGATK